MTDSELWSFVTKFRQLLNAGKKAKLVMESRAGCALINMEVLLNPANHQQEQQHHYRHHAPVHRRAGGGPARVRRHAQRAQARQETAQGQSRSNGVSHPLPSLNTVDVQANTTQASDPPDQNPPAEEAAHHHLPQHRAEEVAHNLPQHRPLFSGGEPVQCLPHHRDEGIAHHLTQHPLLTVEETAHHIP